MNAQNYFSLTPSAYGVVDFNETMKRNLPSDILFDTAIDFITMRTNLIKKEANNEELKK